MTAVVFDCFPMFIETTLIGWGVIGLFILGAYILHNKAEPKKKRRGHNV